LCQYFNFNFFVFFLHPLIIIGSFEDITQSVGSLIHLNHLDMSECNWLECTLLDLAKQLKHLDYLQHLNLSGCNNVEGSISDLCELKQLTSLNVWCCEGIGEDQL
jgi:hypothetical protein